VSPKFFTASIPNFIGRTTTNVFPNGTNVTVNMQVANLQPPVVNNPGNQSTHEGQTVALQIVAGDPNGEPLTCSAGGLPPGLSIDPPSCLISGAPLLTAAGTYPMIVTASDGTLGALTPIGAPVATDTSPASVAVDPSGRFAYVANDFSNEVLLFAIDATTGALTPGTPVTAREGPVSIVLTRGTAPVTVTPRFAYTANQGSDNVSGFSIDATSGMLTAIAGSPFPTGQIPVSIRTDPLGRFVYVANVNSGDISGFTIDSATGALAAVPGSPVALNENPIALAIDPSGRFLYAASFSLEGAGNIWGFLIDSTTGALTAIPGAPFPAADSPNSISVDPSGRFVYVVASFLIIGYAIDAGTGILVPFTSLQVTSGDEPLSITVEPSGQFVYVGTGAIHNDILGFSIDPANGNLTAIPGLSVSTTGPPLEIAVDPSARFVYVVDSSIDLVSGYMIDPRTGVLKAIPGSPFEAGNGLQSITVTLSGRSVFAANGGTNNISGYSIDATTGALTPLLGSPFPTGSGPRSVTTTGTTQ
jgi:6-phosphogluconolactonase (cycloisomerase 2 family)